MIFTNQRFRIVGWSKGYGQGGMVDPVDGWCRSIDIEFDDGQTESVAVGRETFAWAQPRCVDDPPWIPATDMPPSLREALNDDQLGQEAAEEWGEMSEEEQAAAIAEVKAMAAKRAAGEGQ